MVTLLAIFTQRNFHEEYFIRQNILNVFAQETVTVLTPLNENTTIAGQPWSEFKQIAMTPEFEQSELFVSIFLMLDFDVLSDRSLKKKSTTTSYCWMLNWEQVRLRMLQHLGRMISKRCSSKMWRLMEISIDF